MQTVRIATVVLATAVGLVIVLHSIPRWPQRPRRRVAYASNAAGKRTLASLPPEIHLLIAGWLSVEDLRYLASTCHDFKAIVRTPTLWRTLAVRRDFSPELYGALERRTQLALAAELEITIWDSMSGTAPVSPEFEEISGSISPKAVVFHPHMLAFYSFAHFKDLMPGIYIPFFRIRLGIPARSIASWRFTCRVEDRPYEDGLKFRTVKGLGREPPLGFGGVTERPWLAVQLDRIAVEEGNVVVTLAIFDMALGSAGTVAVDLMGLEMMATLVLAAAVGVAVVLYTIPRRPRRQIVAAFISTSKTGLAALPPELHLRIAAWLDEVPDLRRLASTCRDFSAIVRSPSLWRTLAVRRFGKERLLQLVEGLEDLGPARLYMALERRTRLAIAAELEITIFDAMSGAPPISTVFEEISGSPKPVVFHPHMWAFLSHAHFKDLKPGTYIPYFRIRLGFPARSISSWHFTCTVLDRPYEPGLKFPHFERLGRELPLGFGGVLVRPWVVVRLDPVTVEEDNVDVSLGIFDTSSRSAGTIAVDVFGLEKA
ncbi:hypothetical protein HK101_000587 [Irineochytrium annulatum]|nr:hypothetical protein HK101_000587 [Irineochytrium annulatum]